MSLPLRPFPQLPTAPVVVDASPRGMRPASPFGPIKSRISVRGTVEYATAGTFTFIVPAGVFYISAVGVGGGGLGGISGVGGGGGALAYVNRIPVTPGERLTVVVSTVGNQSRRTGIYRSNGVSGQMLLGAGSGASGGEGGRGGQVLVDTGGKINNGTANAAKALAANMSGAYISLGSENWGAVLSA